MLTRVAARWLRFLARRGVLLLCLPALAGLPSPASPSAVPVQAQTRTLVPNTACVAWSGRACQAVPAQLPFYWDQQFSDHAGTARFTFLLPTPPSHATPMALLLPRVGNGFAVRLNGQTLMAVGADDQQRHDTVKRPWLLPLPAEAWGPNSELALTLFAADGRAAQLHPPRLGSLPALQAEYDRLNRWRVELTLVLAWMAALLAAMGLLVWVVQRERVFLACALAEACWALRLAEMFWIDMPLPWQWWGAGVATLFAITQLSMAYFFLQVVGRWSRFFQRAYLVYGGLWLMVVPLIVLLRWRDLWVGWLSANTLMFLGLAVYVGWHSFRQRQFWRWLFAAWVVASVAAGLADILESPGSMYMHPTWSRLVMAAFSLAMVGLVARRLHLARLAQRRQTEQLREALNQQSAELRQAFERQNRLALDHALLEERARVMRDMHDGLGAQLSGLLSLAGQADTPRQALQDGVRGAIAELRQVVDTMGPFDGHLATMLGNLRPLLESRLALAQVQLRWAVDELPSMPDFSPAKVQHLRHLLLEAVTNTARHAGARSVQLSARVEPGAPASLVLGLSDDGCGFDANAPHAGHGLRNMRWRAQALGGRLDFVNHQGCTLVLTLPLPVGLSPGFEPAPAAASLSKPAAA